MALAIGTGTPPLPSRDAEQGAACLWELFQQKPSTAPCIPRLCPHRQRCLHRHGKGRTEAPGAFAARCLEGRKLQWDFFFNIFFLLSGLEGYSVHVCTASSHAWHWLRLVRLASPGLMKGKASRNSRDPLGHLGPMSQLQKYDGRSWAIFQLQCWSRDEGEHRSPAAVLPQQSKPLFRSISQQLWNQPLWIQYYRRLPVSHCLHLGFPHFRVALMHRAYACLGLYGNLRSCC